MRGLPEFCMGGPNGEGRVGGKSRRGRWTFWARGRGGDFPVWSTPLSPTEEGQLVCPLHRGTNEDHHSEGLSRGQKPRQKGRRGSGSRHCPPPPTLPGSGWLSPDLEG